MELEDGVGTLGPVLVVVVLVLSAAFGAADQYLGSLPGAHLWAATHAPWASDVSLLSAPWLLLPFLAGATQREPRRAALLGAACTASALGGYALMTLSPVEHAELTLRSAGGFLWSSDRVIAGGLVTGPLFGWLGYRWHAKRAWLGALLVAGAFCLEPLARGAAGQAIRSRAVWTFEIAVGLILAAYVAAEAVKTRRRARTIA